MANWPDVPEWCDPRLINGGKEYSASDGVVNDDLNAIIKNLRYLYLFGGEGNAILIPQKFTSNGTYNATDYGAEGFSSVEIEVETGEGAPSSLPIEVRTEEEMDDLLETSPVGSVYKYKGETGVYEYDALYTIIIVFIPGVYDAQDEMLASWSDLVVTYDIDVAQDYTASNYNTEVISPSYILTNVSELSGVVKVFIGNAEKIGNYSFCECTNLKHVLTGNNVAHIGSAAFRQCTSLESVKIGSSVATIGEQPFSGCTSLTNIEVDENNSSFKVIDDVLYTIDGKNLVVCTKVRQDTTLTIPDGVELIRTDACAHSSTLEEVVIPDTVMCIYAQAFLGCRSLKKVTIGSAVKQISPNAFSNCISLETVEFTGTVAQWNAIDLIDGWYNDETPITKVICSDGEVNLRLDAPAISIAVDTLIIDDAQGLATSYDILVNGEVKTTVEKSSSYTATVT